MNRSVTRVKICGITNREDAETAIAAGADAIGFNLWKGSKRCIDLDRESAWIRALPPFVSKIAVMVNATAEEARTVARLAFVDAIQFHGDESAEFCADFSAAGKPFMKALGVKDDETLRDAADYGTPHLLLDAHAPGEYGGTGRQIDWDVAARFVREHPETHVILSGGLTPANVAEAVRVVRPYAVDVASGVEEEGEPRRKDTRRVREFVSAVRFGV